MPSRVADSVPQQPSPLTHGRPQGQSPSADRVPGRSAGRWGDTPVADAPRRGPATALAAERARQARMAVVGAVTERWAPEQAGPVHENWQLAPPIGPATDLWALGALLFRAVQGHAPVSGGVDRRAGAAGVRRAARLRRGVRAAPARRRVAAASGPHRAARLRGAARLAALPRPVGARSRRPVRTSSPRRPPIRAGCRSYGAGASWCAGAGPACPRPARTAGTSGPGRRAQAPRQTGPQPAPADPAGLLAAAVAYAMFFMPKAKDGSAGGQRTGTGGGGRPRRSSPAGDPDASSEPRPEQTSPGGGTGNSAPRRPDLPVRPVLATGRRPTGPDAAARLHRCARTPTGFRIAVANGWDRTRRRTAAAKSSTRTADFELIVVPGRDTRNVRQRSDGVPAGAGVRVAAVPRLHLGHRPAGCGPIDVGGRAMAEGQFTWQNSSRQ